MGVAIVIAPAAAWAVAAGVAPAAASGRIALAAFAAALATALVGATACGRRRVAGTLIDALIAALFGAGADRAVALVLGAGYPEVRAFEARPVFVALVALFFGVLAAFDTRAARRPATVAARPGDRPSNHPLTAPRAPPDAPSGSS